MKTINLDTVLAKVDFVEIPEDKTKEIEGGCSYLAHTSGGCNGGYFMHFGVYRNCGFYNAFSKKCILDNTTQIGGRINCPPDCMPINIG